MSFSFIPGSLEGLGLLATHGLFAIVITNQSVLHRGLVSERTLFEMHAKMLEAVARAGGDIMDIFYCPHTPEENCKCRKPGTGMIEAATKKYPEIDLAGSFMIGDSEKDMVLAQRAGIGKAVLVRTGNGRNTEEKLKADAKEPDFVAPDLLAAAKWVVTVPG